MATFTDFEKKGPDNKQIRKELFHSLRETLLLGIEEFSKSISRTFHTSKQVTDKHQIDSELVEFEETLAKERFDMPL